MNTEQIYKLQADRTFYLRGFTGLGAAASLCQTSPSGFTACGVFRDMADFCVLVIFDADNKVEHYSVRYLPDFDLSGIKLSFDVSYKGLQPLDSAKYSWIDWAGLDFITKSGQPGKIKQLWDYATLKSGNYSVAQASCTITAPGGCTLYDRLTLFVNNASFDFVAGGGGTASYVAHTLANSVNSYDWSSFSNHSVSVLASADASGNLTLKSARTGHVAISGNSVRWVDCIKFPGIASGSTIYLAGTAYIVQTVDSPTSLTLRSPASAVDGRTVPYLAEFGGLDGNSVTAYIVVRPGNISLSVDNPVISLRGGNSDDVVWSISLDFTDLGIDQLRQAWLTFAPQLPNGAAYVDTEWTASFSNWMVQDPLNKRPLKCAGPRSVRIGNNDNSACIYSGSGWSTMSANNYWHGYGRLSSRVGDAVTVSYSSRYTHDLYVGTS